MKAVLALLSGLLGFFVVYLLGSFYSTDFNIKYWEADTRSGVVFFGILATAAMSLIVYTEVE